MSRAYDISDFAAFLRKYGDSGRDRAGRTEEPLRDGSQRTRPDRDRQQPSGQARNGYVGKVLVGSTHDSFVYSSCERIRVANEYDLKVVDHKIPIPDLRIEYED